MRQGPCAKFQGEYPQRKIVPEQVKYAEMAAHDQLLSQRVTLLGVGPCVKFPHTLNLDWTGMDNKQENWPKTISGLFWV